MKILDTIAKDIIEKIKLFEILSPETIEHVINQDIQLQLMLALLVEIDRTRELPLPEFLAKRHNKQKSPENTISESMIHTVLSHPKLARIIALDESNRHTKQQPNIVIIDLIDFLLTVSHKTIDDIKHRNMLSFHSNTSNKIDHMKHLYTHPFLGFFDIHRGIDPGFEDHRYNQFYWANHLIFHFQLSKPFDATIIRYSTYFDIHIDLDNNKQAFIETMQRHQSLYECKSKSFTIKLLNVINEKRCEFGLFSFKSDTLTAFSESILMTANTH